LKNKRKYSKNISRCLESNGVKNFKILVHLVYFAALEIKLKRKENISRFNEYLKILTLLDFTHL
jgi:hypothetical protein